MEKQTKNTITREWIKNELRIKNIENVRSALWCCGVSLLVFLPMTFGLVNGLVSSLKSLLLAIVLSVALGSLLLFPVWISFSVLCESLKEKSLLSKDAFEVKIETLSYKKTSRVGKHTTNNLHFAYFNDVLTEDVTYQISSPGDEFYLVYYKGSKGVKLHYPLKRYEYNEQ